MNSPRVDAFKLRLILVALLVAGAWAFAGCSDDGHNERVLEHRIAHACDPMKNVGVDYHGPGWSTDGRYEITCSDGSQRVVWP